MFAILGLRSLYFALAGLIDRFASLKVSLAAVLIVVGAKMLSVDWLKAALGPSFNLYLLGVVVLVLGLGVVGPSSSARATGCGAKPPDRRVTVRAAGGSSSCRGNRTSCGGSCLWAEGPRQPAPQETTMAKVKPVPKGYHTLTPGLTISRCAEAIEFYKRALGAEEVSRMAAPDGSSVWHAELRIGDSVMMVNDPMPGMSPEPPSAERHSPVAFYLYMPDCDVAFDRAVTAGAAVIMPVSDMFWGDRCGQVVDPFGFRWTLATRVKDMTEEEIRRAGEEAAKQMAEGGCATG